MREFSNIPNELFIIGSLFIVSNNLDTLMERELSEFDTTTKQWFLSIVISNLFSEPPTIKQVAAVMGTSHQNVKQVTLKLEEKGLVNLVRDSSDARVTRLVLTERFASFWVKTETGGERFRKKLFREISEDELASARNVLEKLWSNLELMKIGKKGEED